MKTNKYKVEKSLPAPAIKATIEKEGLKDVLTVLCGLDEDTKRVELIVFQPDDKNPVLKKEVFQEAPDVFKEGTLMLPFSVNVDASLSIVYHIRLCPPAEACRSWIKKKFR
ncbi:MAG TPA: hypothetical protein VE093_07495 [Polyangiaceae bacterium]|nr:hypothetical protein [Polyangiaceae bacterium]